jgi:hypothetical protein
MTTDLNAQVETQKELADGERGNIAKVKIWRREIEFAQKYQKPWQKEAECYLKEYEDEDNGRRHIWDQPNENDKRRYNIFWANTQTLRPLVFSKLPEPNITQRFFDDDEINRIASEMMERVVSLNLDETGAEEVFSKNRDDFLITGRGAARLSYNPGEIVDVKKEAKEGEEQTTVEEVDVTDKKITIEYVRFDDILLSTELEWKKLRWIAFKHLMSKSELDDKFGAAKANKVDLTATIIKEDGNKMSEEEASIFKRAEIWEVWDKTKKEVCWINMNGDEVLLDTIDDPFKLKGFFPVPKLLGIGENPSGCLPIPLYRFYRNQALELNTIDERLKSLTEQLKVCFVYASNAESVDVGNLFNGEDGEGNPMQQMGGMDDLRKGIMFKPLAEIIAAIQRLEERKAVIINNIRDITGLSDIVRGVSIASETATAQELKGNFAISRIQPLQKAEEVFIRDTIRLLTELLVENYSINELAKMSNLKIVDIEGIAKATQEKQQALLDEARQQLDPNAEDYQEKVQMLIEQAKAGFKKTMKIPLNELKGFAATPDQLTQIDKIIKDDKLRTFSIDIETDSTVKIDQQQEKQDRIEFVNALSTMSSALFPLVEAKIINEDAFNKFLTFVATPFKVGRNLQEFLIKKDEEQEETPPSPEQIAAQAEIQYKQQDLAIKKDKIEKDYDLGKERNQIDKAKVIKEMNEFDTELEFEDVNRQADRDAKYGEEVVKSKTKLLSDKIRNANFGVES